MPSAAYERRLQQLLNPESEPEKPKKKQKRVRVTDSVLYNRMKEELNSSYDLVEKRNQQVRNIHDLFRNHEYIVPVFSALNTVHAQVEEFGLKIEDINILLYANRTPIFPRGMLEIRGINRLVSLELLGETIVKSHKNYFITLEGKTYLKNLTSLIRKCVMPLVKKIKR